MEPLVRKRSGELVPFSRMRMVNAVFKAMKAVGIGTKEDAEKIADAVAVQLYRSYFKKGDIPHVETIQDMIEKTLMERGFPEVAKAYILYREKRRQAREISQALVDGINLIEEYLGQEDWRVRENSNMNYSLQGLNFHVSSSIVARYWLEKLYPEEVARAHKEGDFHIHDLGILGPYTYFGKEVIIAKYRGRILLISFEKLYELIEEAEFVLDSHREAYAKRPEDLWVLDKEGWVKVTRITRKRKDKNMRFLKNRGGRSVIVTEDHPMITRAGEKEAREVKVDEDELFTVDLRRLLLAEPLFSVEKIDLLKEILQDKTNFFGRSGLCFNGLPVEEYTFGDEEGILHTRGFSAPRYISLTEDFGYFVGFTLAEGYLSYDEDAPRTISIVQKDMDKLLEINEKLKKVGFIGCIRRKGNFYELRITNPFLRFLFERVFRIEPGAKNKCLPIYSLYYNLSFLKGVIGGLLDGDGSIESNGTVLTLRLSARSLLEGLSVILSLLGFTPRDRSIEGQGSIRIYQGKEIIQRYPLYGLSFRKLKDIDLPSQKYREAKVSEKAWHDEDRDNWHKVINNLEIEIPDAWIYDITTESGTLVVNGMWNHNCVGWDLFDLLQRGFGGVSGKVESAPPKHFRSALGQIVNFFYTLQGESAGAQAFSNFDTLLAPFVRYDKLSYQEVKQCMQEFLFNVNVPTRVGFQTPFTNLTFDLKPSKLYAQVNVIIGGKPKEEVYGEFHKEMSMINRAFCELMMAGDAKGRIFTFPIPTYNITKDFDWDNPDYEPLWEMTRKYGIPYFANFVNSDMDPDDARSMCCRLRLDQRELRKRGGGLFGANPLTGSIGVVTINLPRLAYLSTCEEEFFERLERLMELAKTSLEIKRKIIEDFTEKGLYPYSRVYLSGVKEARGQYWANHFSTIGIVGMNEACLNFLEEPIYTEAGKAFALKVLKFMRDKISEFQETTGNLYNLEATPAEGTSYRLARLDKKKFPRIKTQGTDEIPYYTNSVHLPVYYTDDIFEILLHQDDLQVMFTGGTVVHLFVGEEITDRTVVKELVRAVVSRFRLPYFSITPTFSVCPVHGYIPGKHEICPLPHSEQELERFGVDLILPASLLNSLSEGAYRIFKT